MKSQVAGNESGAILVIVACLTALTAILAIGLMSESGSHLKSSLRGRNIEQAFFIAEAGTERAVAYIRGNGRVPTNLTGNIKDGHYSVFILSTPDTTGDGNAHTVSGSISINPNNSPNAEFMLLTTDNRAFDRDTLADSSLQDYTGNAYLLRVKPKGSSDQTITVDGSSYSLDRNMAYNFAAPSFPVSLTNDNRNTNGLAMGKWWININGSGISIGDDPDLSGGKIVNFSIYSIGTVGESTKTILLDGVHQESWSRYALWYDSGPGEIWFTSGEVFNGPVHANTYVYLTGNPIFNALLSSTESSWGSGPAGAVFNAGFQLNAPEQSMASVNFNDLYKAADLVVTGQTRINIAGSNMFVSNIRSGWTNETIPIASNFVVYVTNANTGSFKKDVYVGGVLDGRLTIVTDNDIHITNHLTYAMHPTNNSDDALGLIANHDVILDNNTPNNINIFAHIMAVGGATPNQSTDGSFKVNNTSRSFAGNINLYGGIVQFYRGAVGTTAPTGYRKNYCFDTRFLSEPPPEYPTLTNEYSWSGWRER